MTDDILKPVREVVAAHKAKQTPHEPHLSRPPSPSLCPRCSYHNGGMFIRCPMCKRAMPGHIADCVVGAGSLGIAIYSVYTGILP